MGHASSRWSIGAAQLTQGDAIRAILLPTEKLASLEDHYAARDARRDKAGESSRRHGVHGTMKREAVSQPQFARGAMETDH
jgi:hypothetical protein